MKTSKNASQTAPARIVSVAATIPRIQSERKKATERLTVILTEAKKLRGILAACDKQQHLAQLELETLAEQQ